MTDAETLDIARMVLVGKVNRDIVSAINVHGPLAVGLSGEDASLITAERRSVDSATWATWWSVDPTILQRLLAEGLIPVVATIGADAAGQAYNINADTVAGAVAAALGAEKLVFLTDVEGLRADPDDPATLLPPASPPTSSTRWWPAGAAQRGMVPKVEACMQAVRGGVRAGPHPRRPGAPRPAARAVHRRRGGHDGDGAGMTRTPRPLGARCAPTPSPRSPSCGARAATCSTPRGGGYLDFISGLAVTSLGHAHPAVAAAVAAQARTSVPRLEPLRQRARPPRWPPPSTGWSAGATGRRAARSSSPTRGPRPTSAPSSWPAGGRGPGRYVVVSAWDSFHGRTLATLTATGQPAKHGPFEPLPEGFVHVPYDDLAALDGALEAAGGGRRPARADPGRGRGGGAVVGLPGRGAGRCAPSAGSCSSSTRSRPASGGPGEWFAFQAAHLRPDVVTMAKALGNGMPVGACWATAEVAAAFGPGDHGSTFGGQPLAMAAARATLAVMEEEDVCAPGPAGPGTRLAAGLAGLPGVRAVRGAGPPAGGRADRALAGPAVAAAPWRPGCWSTPCGPTPCGWRPPCWSPTASWTRPSAVLGRALARRLGGSAGAEGAVGR